MHGNAEILLICDKIAILASLPLVLAWLFMAGYWWVRLNDLMSIKGSVREKLANVLRGSVLEDMLENRKAVAGR